MAKKRKSDGKPVDKASQKSDTAKVVGRQSAELRIYQEKPGDVPLLDFLDGLKPSDVAEVRAALGLLAEKGHELRPPLNEHLGDQIYYLRINGEDGTYRVFYWPFGKGIVVLGHGFSKKQQKCPPEQIKRAKKMKARFEANPEAHTCEGETDGNDDEA
jgi:phage-related protein